MCDCVARVESIISQLPEHRWTHPLAIGEGAAKVALGLCDQHVLKVASNPTAEWNATQLVQEIEVWEKADENLRHRLCPIVASHKDGINSWILAMRADTSESGYSIAREADYREFYKTCNDAGIADLHSNNWGQLNGRYVCIDYGIKDE